MEEESTGRSDYFALCRKGFPHRRGIAEVDSASEGAIIVAKPKGAVKLPAVDTLSPDFIAYVPAPLLDLYSKKTSERDSNTNEMESDEVSDSEEDDENADGDETAQELDAQCLQDVLEYDRMVNAKRDRRPNSERVGQYEKIVMETEAITRRVLEQFVNAENYNPGG